MRRSRAERAERPFLPATASASSMADFPLGSLQSRAAARSLIARRRDMECGEGILIVVREVGKRVDPNRKCTCRVPPAGEFAVCRCFCD
jgi:hypothetical protein